MRSTPSRRGESGATEVLVTTPIVQGLPRRFCQRSRRALAARPPYGEGRRPIPHPSERALFSMTIDVTAATTDRTIRIVDPATGGPVGELPVADAAAGAAAVRRAVAAFPDWAATSPARRGELLRAAAGALAERAEELAEL